MGTYDSSRARGALLAVGFLMAALAACSSNGRASNPGPQEGSSSLSLTLTFRTDPGKETHWCQYVRIPKGTSDKLILTGYRWKMATMHHWTLYRTTPDLPKEVPTDQPFDCFAPGAASYMQAAAITQEFMPESRMSFEPGAGFALDSEGVVVIQAHTLNATAAPIEPQVTIQLDFADPSTVPNKLGLIQFYDPYIVVPPRATASAHMRCNIPRDLTVIRRWGHMHVRGIEANVFLDPPGAPPDTTPVASVTDWEHPPVLLDKLQLPKDSKVRMVCNYLGTDTPAFQGPNKLDNEMCMFIAYYYPEITPQEGGTDFENCINGDWYGTGTTSCSELLSCIQACPAGDRPNVRNTKVDVGPCWQQCVVDSCPSATTPFGELRDCLETNCSSECASFGAACNSCVASKCVGEFATCQAATCN